jgi:hypothetical protein
MTRESSDPRFGPWKFIHEISRLDLNQHPVWVWCSQLYIPDEEDGPIGGDETSMRPVLDPEYDFSQHFAPPLVQLLVESSDVELSALYQPAEDRLEDIAVVSHHPRDVLASLPRPVRLIAPGLKPAAFVLLDGSIEQAVRSTA